MTESRRTSLLDSWGFWGTGGSVCRLQHLLISAVHSVQVSNFSDIVAVKKFLLEEWMANIRKLKLFQETMSSNTHSIGITGPLVT